eukprot:COSAG05_NODE_1663_length_4312_cov_16.465243_6_plen_48_part_00
MKGWFLVDLLSCLPVGYPLHPLYLLPSAIAELSMIPSQKRSLHMHHA